MYLCQLDVKMQWVNHIWDEKNTIKLLNTDYKINDPEIPRLTVWEFDDLEINKLLISLWIYNVLWSGLAFPFYRTDTLEQRPWSSYTRYIIGLYFLNTLKQHTIVILDTILFDKLMLTSHTCKMCNAMQLCTCTSSFTIAGYRYLREPDHIR